MKGPEIMKIARKLCRKPMSQKEIENISYKEMMPLQLKNSVSGKSDKSAGKLYFQLESPSERIIYICVILFKIHIFIYRVFRCVMSPGNGRNVRLHEEKWLQGGQMFQRNRYFWLMLQRLHGKICKQLKLKVYSWHDDKESILITALHLCLLQANKKMKKEREESGKIVSGTNVRNLTTKQLNSLLQKYPQHNVKL